MGLKDAQTCFVYPLPEVTLFSLMSVVSNLGCSKQLPLGFVECFPHQSPDLSPTTTLCKPTITRYLLRSHCI